MSEKAITLKTWDKINALSKKYSLFKRGDGILLAFSGGPDSMLMLDYFAKAAQNKNLRLFVCHVNHMIRKKDSDADETFAVKTAKKYGIEIFTKRINIPAISKKKKKSPEHAARDERYKFLIETAVKKNCSAVATAHHLGDHAETVLLNLIRGTSPKGLLGIPVKRPVKTRKKTSLNIIRPLLFLSKKEILIYIKANRLPFVKDATNEDEKYFRNWIRKNLIPQIEMKQPKFKEHILEMSSKLRKALENN